VRHSGFFRMMASPRATPRVSGNSVRAVDVTSVEGKMLAKMRALSYLNIYSAAKVASRENSQLRKHLRKGERSNNRFALGQDGASRPMSQAGSIC
jgi:hypothetical protein